MRFIINEACLFIIMTDDMRCEDLTLSFQTRSTHGKHLYTLSSLDKKRLVLKLDSIVQRFEQFSIEKSFDCFISPLTTANDECLFLPKNYLYSPHKNKLTGHFYLSHPMSCPLLSRKTVSLQFNFRI